MKFEIWNYILELFGKAAPRCDKLKVGEIYKDPKGALGLYLGESHYGDFVETMHAGILSHEKFRYFVFLYNNRRCIIFAEPHERIFWRVTE